MTAPTGTCFPPFVLRDAGLRLPYLFQSRDSCQLGLAGDTTHTHPSDDNLDYCQRIAKIPAVPPRILDHMYRSRSSNPGTVKTGKLSNRRPARETIGEASSRCSSCDRLNAESLAPPYLGRGSVQRRLCCSPSDRECSYRRATSTLSHRPRSVRIQYSPSYLSHPVCPSF